MRRALSCWSCWLPIPRRGLTGLASCLLALGLAAGAPAQVLDALREAAGLTGLTKWADVQAIDGRGRRHVAFQYNDNKLQYSHKVQVERADDGAAPYGYEGDWRVYRGDGLLFLAADQGGKVHHVFEGGRRVPFLDLFRRYLEGEHGLPTASGERTLTLEIDPDVIAALERRRGNDAAGSASGSPAGGGGSDTVLVWSLDSEVDDEDDITSRDQLEDFRAGPSDFDAFSGEIGEGGSVLGSGPVSDPQLKEAWCERYDKYFYRVDLQQSVDVPALWMLVVDGSPQPRHTVSRYSFGRYVVYGSLGDPNRGLPFLAISLSSLSDEERGWVSGWGQRLIDLGGRVWNSIGGGEEEEAQDAPFGQ